MPEGSTGRIGCSIGGTMRASASKLKPIWRRFPVRFAYLWGSPARGTARPESDDDFAVSMNLPSRRVNPFLDLGTALCEARRNFEHHARLLYWDEAIRLQRYVPALAERVREGRFGT